MADADEFRASVHCWLVDNCPASMRVPYSDEKEWVWGGQKGPPRSPDQELWLRRMAAKGWTAPEWPLAYGGAALSGSERRILREEMTALSCRPPLHSFGISMLAPALFKYATEEQRQTHLPPMARGEVRWCQGYSEPNAGSDLASLSTSAVRSGDSYVVNGSKIWTSYADVSDWIFCLVRTARTENKREGISFLLIDMVTDGITTKPIKLISGASPFCQVFFDNVLVPAENLVGEEGAGWAIAKHLLTHERSMISGIARKESGKNPLVELALAHFGTKDGILNESSTRDSICSWEIDAASFDCLRNMLKIGPLDFPAQSSVLKYYGTEINKRRRELMMDVAGHDGLIGSDDEGEPFSTTAKDWLRSKANSIEGGTSEIQLNIIANRALGLV